MTKGEGKRREIEELKRKKKGRGLKNENTVKHMKERERQIQGAKLIAKNNSRGKRDERRRRRRRRIKRKREREREREREKASESERGRGRER